MDDDPVSLKAVAEVLRAEGHSVETARSGREALETFRRRGFDLVVTDLAMPDMSGDSLAAAIKRVAPQMPIIMLTGFGDLMEAAGETPAGVDRLVPKPFTRDSLQEAMAKLISA